jgi:cystathionine beta-lyase
MQDIPAISKLAHAKNICVLMDNTWATPLFFPPHERGVDIAIEAGTKYLSGHSDLLLGLVTANEKYWPALKNTFDITSPCITGEDAFLALRGLRTMKMRLEEAERQGLRLAHWLQKREEVIDVLHPALPTHKGHAIWNRDFSGSSGLFSVILKPASETALAAFLDGLELFGMGYSWGGYESLVVPFDCTPYRTATKWQPNGIGLRFQVGYEDINDLTADLDAAFARMKAAS